MFLTTEHRNGTASPRDSDAPEGAGAVAVDKRQRPVNGKPEHRLLLAPPMRPTVSPDAQRDKARPVLAVFCYEEPASTVGQFLAKMAPALVRRGTAVHVFTRKGLDESCPGVTVHELGEPDDGDLFERVQEFTHRACNAFLTHFQAATAHVSLMGFEWSSVQALSILRGIKNLDIVLSLHSLECQRGDLSSDVSKKIEDIELTGLREAKTILVHEPATADAARRCAPECGDRITRVREMFPVAQFADQLDPGAIKARYQVGPVDPTILFVGDLSERYGPDLLVKAMPAVLKNHRQARLVIVGDGSLYWPLRVYTRYLLLEHAVRLVGHLEGQALNELIQAADVVVVPSREATPWWIILAAWSAGKPVVATHDAAPALLEHELDSVLFYPNENSCVWGVERMLFAPELGIKLAQNGLRKVDDRFGWNAVAEQVERLMGVKVS
jgi:glycogen synthase